MLTISPVNYSKVNNKKTTPNFAGTLITELDKSSKLSPVLQEGFKIFRKDIMKGTTDELDVCADFADDAIGLTPDTIQILITSNSPGAKKYILDLNKKETQPKIIAIKLWETLRQKIDTRFIKS